MARDAATPDLRRRLDGVRALFAESVAIETPSRTLGDIVLRPDQLETARRVRAHLRRDGGCLLADDVGTGKTYVALAVARDCWSRALVVAPASLRGTWARAAEHAGVPCGFVSHEALSRGRGFAEPFDGIILDESHRFRPTSRRHDALARLAARAPVLMLSATPLQNRARELAAQLALFLGEVAYRLEPHRLTEWVVRSAASAESPLPRVAPPRWVAVNMDDGEVLRAILALPPPPRAADAGDGGVLLQLSLVRAWASSRHALREAVRRRQRTLAAIEQCRLEGRLPTRRELRSWDAGGDVQLGFPALLASTSVGAAQREALAQAIERERRALDALLGTIRRADDADGERVATLRRLRSVHAGASILAFSEWATTVRAYWSALGAEPGVGMLTASEARIASGRVSRDELLARFAPRAQGARIPPPHERVTLLLATDLLSEGVNLQDASVVVHLDLPWNPARLAQRLGRIRRPGGASEVASYLVAPPARASLLLQAERRLRTKLARAEATIGRSVAVLPALGPTVLATVEGGPGRAHQGPPAAPLSSAELRGAIAQRLARWRALRPAIAPAPDDDDGAIAAVRAETPGWLALLDDGRLVASCVPGGARPGATDAPDSILHALEHADGAPRRASGAECARSLGELDEWIAREWTRRSSGLEVADTPLRRRMRRALDDALHDAPRHSRAATLASAAIVRDALGHPLPLGIERELCALADDRSARGDWLARAAALVARAPIRARERSVAPRCRALILFGP